MIAGLNDDKKKGKDDGPELTSIGSRHSVAWLHSYIEDPTRFRGDTAHMPAFEPPVLSHQEIEEISLYLSSLRGPPVHPVALDIHDTFPDIKKGMSKPMPGGAP